ncbi:uncharacterized protein ATNIH1004_009079 [Aspergillus tanneri]|uniref:Hyaluronan/mRNA-binding protein domain-containing protein n=1 Tax=Aspergillus tanneri TaxID=1220188 RepID=A0A5M9MHN2_9EURO|nr:uncharacterized protein ATNIH1004_009079 [Aspergillus tanneri]KAA8644870.1 hypothetical protein ATNIH1004_009079 [Aspergillus tanneri]
MDERVTRSHKTNDRDHSAIHDGVAVSQEQLPRYFAKSGPVDADPRKTKKNGGGKRNWGRSGDEVQDYDYNFTNARRYSNSSTQGIADFKTKFETREPEPVFEEHLHGTLHEGAIIDGSTVTKVDNTCCDNSADSGIQKSSIE